MKTRLNRITTKTGDQGETGLADGARISKTDCRITTMGSLDELNCHIGIVLTETLPDEVNKTLQTIQHHLFDLGSAIALPGHQPITENQVTWLETHIASLNDMLPPLKEFILPGGNRPAALCHLARSVCRRVECNVLTMHHSYPWAMVNNQYLNRLSDLLFVLARVLARQNDGQEILWKNTPSEK